MKNEANEMGFIIKGIHCFLNFKGRFIFLVKYI